MDYLSSFIKGFSQVFLQNNIIFGILIIAGLAIVSPTALFLAFVGNIAGVMTGLLLGTDKTAVEIGKFGFNGVLIGAVASVYIKQLPVAVVVTVVAACIGAVIYYFLLRNHIEPFAVPFVLAAWTIVMVAKVFP